MTGGSGAWASSTGLSALPDAYHKHRRVTMIADRAVSTPRPAMAGRHLADGQHKAGRLPSGKPGDLTRAMKAGDMVRMTEHTNSSQTPRQKQDRLRAEIRKGLDDIEAGRTVDGDAAFDALRQALASKDDRHRN